MHQQFHFPPVRVPESCHDWVNVAWSKKNSKSLMQFLQCILARPIPYLEKLVHICVKAIAFMCVHTILRLPRLKLFPSHIATIHIGKTFYQACIVLQPLKGRVTKEWQQAMTFHQNILNWHKCINNWSKKKKKK